MKMNLAHLLIACLMLPNAPVIADSGINAKEARVLFQKPPREYSTGPLWVWNDMLTDDQIRDTLRDMARQHVKQVWVHPRPGLMTPYLSPQWFHLWKVALKEAERLNMNVWIYDENSYPSGFAGGWVPEEMPESRGRGLALKETEQPPKCTDETLGIYALNGEKVENVTERVRAGEKLPNGKYLVATQVRSGDSPWHGGRSYVNLLSPGVTEKFLELTITPYQKEIGGEFGRRVPGIFTDEPNINPTGALPWSEDLAAAFQKRWGYSLLENLPCLKTPVGDWKKVRHNYFQLLHELFVERWAKPYHDWCERTGLAWTGHYWDHEWPNCVGVPDNMAMYAWHQWPAIDCLMNQYAENTHAQFGNVRMVKELSSAVNQLGQKRTLCEIYGAGSWDLRFEDMKRIGDWLEVLGVNTLNQHLSYVTLRGARKRDHPQSFSYHEPWWDAYHISADYFARLSAALSQGEQVNTVLVLEPTTSAWMYQGDGAKLAQLGDSFFRLLLALESAQVEYDLGSEDIIAHHGSVSRGVAKVPLVQRTYAQVSRTSAGAHLVVGNRSYATVVIPSLTESLNSETAKMLEEFLAAGGTVICQGEAPSLVDGSPSETLKKITAAPGWTKASPDLAQQLAPKLDGIHGLAFYRDPKDAGILFHMRRELKDGQLLFLVNTSIEQPSRGSFESGYKNVERWDPYTGSITPYVSSARGQGMRAEYDLPPSGSLLLFLSDTPNGSSKQELTKPRTIEHFGTPTVTRLEPNVLTLDFVDVSAGGQRQTNVYFYRANQFTWQQNGMPRNPWDSAVQFKDELIAKQFPADSGFEASYQFTLKEAVPPDLAIVIERPDLYTITCNGCPVQASKGWWLDKAFHRVPLGRVARLGRNVVVVKAQPFSMFHELEPAYLIGDFRVSAASSGFEVSAAKPLECGPGWNEQGLPFYSAGVAYSEEFSILEHAAKTYKVRLGQWRGSVAKVSVNGQDMGFIDAAPWQCDVTKRIKPGRNTVVVTVIGTLKNTLGPHHGKPALGSAWPGSFQQGPQHGPPPGGEYSTVAYGLFEPFVLTAE